VKPRSTIFTLALLVTAQCAFAHTNLPILIGEGRDKISAEAIGHIADLARSVRGDAVGLWLLHCDAYKSGTNVGHVFRVHACFSPRISSGRLLRGQGVLCLDWTLPQYWDGKSARFGGWYTSDRKPGEYGWVAPAGQSLETNRPTEKPFDLLGTLSNSDVISIVDAVQLSATNQSIQSLEAVDESHIRVHTVEGSGWKGFRIEFEKVAGVWNETRRGKWRV
jgi:hypothetical protein